MDDSGFEIEVDAGRDIVTIRFTGPLTLTNAERAIEAANARPDVSPTTAVLIDTTRALVHDIDVDWLRRCQAFRNGSGYPDPTTALVVSARDESHHLLGQLWAAIRAGSSRQSPGVFTDAAAAVEWLQENRSPPHTMTASA